MYSQDEPRIVEADVPFELRMPWFSADRTEIEDEAVMRGTLHVTTRTWQTRPDHVDRFTLHANAVDIQGTSETTGQRFRLNGSFSWDLRDPEVTFNPDGTFVVPLQPWSLHFHKVDPSPARLTSPAGGSMGATGASYYIPPPPPQPCERVYLADGTPTQSISCGNIALTYFLTTLPYPYRVVAIGGTSCVPDTPCVVPDGSTLFNGYTGGYNAPLFMQSRLSRSGWDEGTLDTAAIKWHCKTGDKEAPVSHIISGAGIVMGSCRPIYSATEPIKVWAEISYRYYRYVSSEQPAQPVTLVVHERPFTFYMDERPTDQPPVISSFSVWAQSRATGRCAPGELCELINGDLLFNTVQGDYNLPLTLRVSASDAEGDPIMVEWVCKSGSHFAPITNQVGTQANCSPGYIFPDAIEVYARVSDGNNVIETPKRLLYMLEFIH